MGPMRVMQRRLWEQKSTIWQQCTKPFHTCFPFHTLHLPSPKPLPLFRRIFRPPCSSDLPPATSPPHALRSAQITTNTEPNQTNPASNLVVSFLSNPIASNPAPFSSDSKLQNKNRNHVVLTHWTR
ncbi:hypothetical protein VNO77_28122 [Canavalia gladiata]|uniref:Uncharacterized protein n=1 Tax=Canavalia gladiata TaxID=3824 RepID=A0AAN9Q7M9_CANGL